MCSVNNVVAHSSRTPHPHSYYSQLYYCQSTDTEIGSVSRVINTSARILQDHGLAHAEWARKHAPHCAPLPVLRAALTLPDPFGKLPSSASAYLSRLVGNAADRQEEQEFAWLQRELQLESAVEVATQRAAASETANQGLLAHQQDSEVTRQVGEVASLRAEADALRRELTETRRLLAEAASSMEVATAAQRAERAASLEVDRLRQVNGDLTAELSHSTPIDKATLTRFLVTVSTDLGIDRGVRRWARSLLEFGETAQK